MTFDHKNNISRIKKNLDLLILTVLSLGIGAEFPFVYWATVDDGVMIQMAQRMNAGLGNIFRTGILLWIKDPALGRFRPMYWIFDWVIYNLFGISHFWHGLIHILILTSIVFIAYSVTKMITKSRLSAFLAGTFFLVNTINQENWYRLGPQETTMLFFLASSFLFFCIYLNKVIGSDKIDKNVVLFEWSTLNKIKNIIPVKQDFQSLFKFNIKKYDLFFLLAIVFVIPGYFSKETSIAFIVLPILIYLWVGLLVERGKSAIRSRALLFLLVNIILTVTVFYFIKRYSNSASYAANYVFNMEIVKNTLRTYLWSIWISFEPVVIFSILTTIVELFIFLAPKRRRVIDLNNLWLLATIILAITFFIVQLPWNFAIDRYLLIVMFFLSIFFGIQFAKVIKILLISTKKDLIREIRLKFIAYICLIGTWILVGAVVIYNLAMMITYANVVVQNSNNFNKPLMIYLANNLGKDGVVYFDTPVGSALEMREETELHLRLFFNRKDVGVEYFQSSRSAELKSGDILVRSNQFVQVSSDGDFRLVKLSPPKKINVSLIYILFYPPMQFVKNYSTRWLIDEIKGNDVKFSPILQKTQEDYYWKLYQISNVR